MLRVVLVYFPEALLVENSCVQCAVTDGNQTLVTDLGYCLGYLSVVASGLLLKIKARKEITRCTCRQLCVQCAVTDENQTLVTSLGFHLGYLSVIANACMHDAAATHLCHMYFLSHFGNK
jgi:hypothetical protein